MMPRKFMGKRKTLYNNIRYEIKGCPNDRCFQSELTFAYANNNIHSKMFRYLFRQRVPRLRKESFSHDILNDDYPTEIFTMVGRKFWERWELFFTLQFFCWTASVHFQCNVMFCNVYWVWKSFSYTDICNFFYR